MLRKRKIRKGGAWKPVPRAAGRHSPAADTRQQIPGSIEEKVTGAHLQQEVPAGGKEQDRKQRMKPEGRAVLSGLHTDLDQGEGVDGHQQQEQGHHTGIRRNKGHGQRREHQQESGGEQGIGAVFFPHHGSLLF